MSMRMAASPEKTSEACCEASPGVSLILSGRVNPSSFGVAALGRRRVEAHLAVEPVHQDERGREGDDLDDGRAGWRPLHLPVDGHRLFLRGHALDDHRIPT